MPTFQQLILDLQTYWAGHGCALLQPYDMEVGAGTSHTATFLRALGPEPWNVPPTWSRAADPRTAATARTRTACSTTTSTRSCSSPHPTTSSTSTSARCAPWASTSTRNDVRFVEDDWENPTLGCWGLGLGGVAQRHGGHAVHLLPAGRRHRLQADHGRDHLRPRAAGDVPAGRRERSRTCSLAEGLSYGDVFLQNESRAERLQLRAQRRRVPARCVRRRTRGRAGA